MGKIIEMELKGPRSADQPMEAYRNLPLSEALALLPIFTFLAETKTEIDKMAEVLASALPESVEFQCRRAEKILAAFCAKRSSEQMDAALHMEQVLKVCSCRLHATRILLGLKGIEIYGIVCKELDRIIEQFHGVAACAVQRKTGTEPHEALVMIGIVLDRLRLMCAWFVEALFGTEETEDFEYAKDSIEKVWALAGRVYQ